MKRQDTDVDVAAGHQNVGAADEGRRHDAIGDDVDLPDRGQAEDVAFDHHVANDEHGEGDEEGADDAGNARQGGDGANVNVHGPKSTVPASAAPCGSFASANE